MFYFKKNYPQFFQALHIQGFTIINFFFVNNSVRESPRKRPLSLGAISNCPRGTQASLEVLLLSSKEKSRGVQIRGRLQQFSSTLCGQGFFVFVYFVFFVCFSFLIRNKESKTQKKALSITTTHIGEGASVE